MKLLPLSFPFLCLAAGAPAALAAPEAVSLDLEEITVRGTKADRPYFETVESVSVLGAGDLPAGGRENSLQVLNAVPGVEVHRDGESFSIRGIHSTGVTGYQKDNLSSVVVDGLFQTDLALEAGSFHLWDLETVEVLKGAQSANQGINALAGTILLTHRAAETGAGSPGSARIGASTFRNREFAFAANAAPVADRLGLRLNYAKEMNDGFVTNVATGNDAWGGWNRDRARATLLQRLAGGGEIELDAKFHRNRQGGTYVQSDDPFRDEVREDVDSVTKTRNWQSIARHRHAFSETLRNELAVGLSDTTQRKKSDADGTDRDTAGVRHDRHDDRYYSAENLLRYRSGRWHSLLGFHAHHYVLDDDYAFDLLLPVGGLVTPVALLQGVERRRTTFSVFESAEFRIDDRQSIAAGLRLEHVRNRYSTSVFARRTEDLGGGNATLDPYLASVSGAYAGSESNLTPLPKLAYLLRFDRHYFGLSYARAYRTGGVAINRRRTRAVEYDPEFTNNYELSYKLRGEGVQFSANAFYLDWKKQQVQIQLSNDFYDTQVANAAGSRVRGGEAEARWEAHPAHALRFGGGYSDTKFTDFASGGVDYGGKRFPFASKVTGRVAHEARVTDSLVSLAVARYVSGGFTNAENTRRADAQFTVDWNLRYLRGDWVAEAYANNLFDRRSLLFNGAPTSATSPYPSNTHRVNSPREIGARLTRVF